MRRFVPLMAVTLLGGCGAIPPAIGLASYALDGMSLLASGRTVSDHALSYAVRQDCKLFRAAQNLEVCTDWGTQPQVAATRPVRTSHDRDDPAGWADQAVGVASLDPTPTLVAERDEPMTLPTELADVAKALPGVAKVEAKPLMTATLLVPAKPAVAPQAITPIAPAKLTMTALVPSAPLPAKAVDVGNIVRSDDVQANRDAIRAAYDNRYLMVLGSFKGPEMAGRLAKLHAGLGAKVVKVDVQGQIFYRVVVEPEKGARLQQKLTGADKPWLMPVQTASIAGTLR